MVTAMLKDAIMNGTRSWDTTLQRATILVLHAALASRIGSISQSSTVIAENSARLRQEQASDDPLVSLPQTLVWNDISLALEDEENGARRLSARVTLNFCKGERYVCVCVSSYKSVTNSYSDDPSKSHISDFIELNRSEHNILCPCKMLCILALRYGAVAETSWDELISNMAARPSNKAVWTESFRHVPVFCGITNSQSLQLDFGKPAGGAEGPKALALGANLVGMLGKPTTHDIRRGAAAEIAHLETPLRGSSRDGATRLALHHSVTSYSYGTTDEYVGHLRADTWAARLDAKPMIGAKHDLQFGDSSYRPPKFSKHDLDSLCEKYNLDATDQGERNKAAAMARKDDQDEWIKQQKAILDTPVHTIRNLPVRAPRNTPVQRFHTTAAEKRTKTPSFVNDLPTNQELTIPPSRDGAAIGPHLLDVDDPEFNPMSSMKLIQSTIFDQNQDGQDALLLQVSQLAQSATSSNDINTSSSAVQGACPILTAGRDEFVRFFSTVNIVKLHSPISGQVNTVVGVEGGSRDQVTRYMFLCHNKQFGCIQKFPYLRHREEHSALCKLVCAEAAAERAFRCDQCHQSFKQERDLTRHVKRVHEKDSTLNKCSYTECKDLPAFETLSLLRKHRDRAHKGWIPRLCPHPDCSDVSKIWEDLLTFKKHLTKKHRMGNQEIAPYVPHNIAPGGKRTGTKSEAFITQRCPVPECKSQTYWSTLQDFTAHRLVQHRDYHYTVVDAMLKWKTDEEDTAAGDEYDSTLEDL